MRATSQHFQSPQPNLTGVGEDLEQRHSIVNTQASDAKQTDVLRAVPGDLWPRKGNSGILTFLELSPVSC